MAEGRRQIATEADAEAGKKTKKQYLVRMADNIVCSEEQEAQRNCLQYNGGNKRYCLEHIENYELCMEFWRKVRDDRASKNIFPNLPPEHERAKILENHFGS